MPVLTIDIRKAGQHTFQNRMLNNKLISEYFTMMMCRYHENKTHVKILSNFPIVCMMWPPPMLQYINVYPNRKNRNGRETNVQTVFCFFFHSVSRNVQVEF